MCSQGRCQIHNCQITVIAHIQMIDPETGEYVQSRSFPLKLVNCEMFYLEQWVVYHEIDEFSPFFPLTGPKLIDKIVNSVHKIDVTIKGE